MASTKTSKPDSSAIKPLPAAAFDKLYWARMGSAVVGGVATEALAESFGTDWTVGISIAIGIYLVTYYGALFTWYRGLPRGQQGKVYSTGAGGFAMLFLFTWMLLFTMRVAGLPL